ncbi:hypothetical protein RSOL_219490 [Rhizoctonia solani AG-3 Rhs1AP]|uniref:Uncharacterized protein n=1 Tax=Rhizoctonia solani AG-3 Rhs1AP TaxID=1086054 RepID=X8J7Z9_9AGAM|nr:hypothetical protein RSOL_219490 [Rhizoctonia solani AG-3 Rhs1AP]
MGGIAQRVVLKTTEGSVSDVVKRALERSKTAGPSSDASKPELVPEATPDEGLNPEPEASSKTKVVSAPEPTVKEVASSPADILRNLLDMTHVPPGTEPSHFNSIAQTLMQSFELCVTSKSSTITTYEVLEVEFYWYNQESGHIDPFTHAAEEQRVSGNWYFHRAPRRVPPNSSSTAPVPSPKTSGFRAGTRKGLDLTFGVPASSNSVAYGGILLRTLRNTETRKVTCGPSLLVDEVLRSAGVDSLQALVDTVWKGDTCAFLGSEPGPSRVFLRPIEGKRGGKVAKMYTSPRIGLELSRIQTVGEATATHPRVQYVIRPYRFFTHPELMGTVRPQTFYGLLQAHEAGQLSRAGIADVSGMKPTQVPTFFGYVEAGRKAGPGAVKDFVGEKGKGVGPVAAKFLKMAGVVECILDDSGGERVLKKQKLAPTLTSMFAGGSKSKVPKQE